MGIFHFEQIFNDTKLLNVAWSLPNNYTIMLLVWNYPVILRPIIHFFANYTAITCIILANLHQLVWCDGTQLFKQRKNTALVQSTQILQNTNAELPENWVELFCPHPIVIFKKACNASEICQTRPKQTNRHCHGTPDFPDVTFALDHCPSSKRKWCYIQNPSLTPDFLDQSITIFFAWRVGLWIMDMEVVIEGINVIVIYDYTGKTCRQGSRKHCNTKVNDGVYQQNHTVQSLM